MPTNLRRVRARLTALALLVAGIALVTVALAANRIELSYNPGFGWKKRILLFSGFVFSIAGAWIYSTTRMGEKVFPAVREYKANVLSRWLLWLVDVIRICRMAVLPPPLTHSSERTQLVEPERASGPTIDVGLLVILALPWALFSAGVNWIFDYVIGQIFIDPWIYFGFSLDLPAHLGAFPGTYYGSRLSWILPGYVAHQLFPPVMAAYVLHLGLYYAAVLSLYLTLKHTVGRRAALLSTVLMGCYGYFLWAMGWDYVDGPGIAYFLLTTLALTNASRRQRSWTWLMVSGASYGAMIYSQLFLVIFTPPLLLYYLLANREQWRHSLKLGGLFFATGFLAISVLLGAINLRLGGDFLFYAASVRAASELATASNPWKLPFQVWWQGATWLVLPSLAFLSSMAFVLWAWKSRSDRQTRFQILLQFYYLICASILVLFELRGGSVLQLTYYASLLIPTVFLALGAQLAPVVDRLSSRNFVLVVCGASAIIHLAYQVPSDSRLTVWLNSHAPWLVVGLALLGATRLLLRGVSATAATLSIVCLTLALANVANGSFRVKDPSVSKPGFLAVVESVQVIRSLEPSGNLLFWYQFDEPVGHYYRSVSSTYLWGYSLINERFPSLERDEGASQIPRPNRQLVVLTTEKDAFQKAESALRQIGLGAQLLAERRIQEGPLAWDMLFIKLHYWPFIEEVRLTADEWPEGINLRLESQERQEVSLLGQEARALFRSDMNSNTEWQINRYGRSGGLSIQPSCFASGDSCGLYSSGNSRDHLASPFATLATTDRATVFFSIWVKPLAGSATPRVVLQNERFDTVAESDKLLFGKDGWILLGERLDVQDAKQLRVTVTQPRGSASLVDKAVLVQMSEHLQTLPAAPR